jgi:single-strand DNA-binding protein
MNNLNSVLLEGELEHDPVFTIQSNGVPACSLRLASSRFFKGRNGIEKDVSLFNVEAEGKMAEQCKQLGHKGRGIRVVGRLRQYCRQDGRGQTVERTAVFAEHIEFRPSMQVDQSSEKAPTPGVSSTEPEFGW